MRTPTPEYQTAVAALVNKLAETINAEGIDSSVALDALLNAYVHAATTACRLQECAGYMVQIGGQYLFAAALAQNAGTTPPPSNLH